MSVDKEILINDATGIAPPVDIVSDEESSKTQSEVKSEQAEQTELCDIGFSTGEMTSLVFTCVMICLAVVAIIIGFVYLYAVYGPPPDKHHWDDDMHGWDDEEPYWPHEL